MRTTCLVTFGLAGFLLLGLCGCSQSSSEQANTGADSAAIQAPVAVPDAPPAGGETPPAAVPQAEPAAASSRYSPAYPAGSSPAAPSASPLGSPSAAPAAAARQQTPAPLALPPQPKPITMPAAAASPQDVVSTFLEATRAGNKEIASQLLTQKALEATQKKGLTVQPPGSPSMQYAIGKAEKAPNQGVYVSSTWTESFEDGSKESFEVVWVLRSETRGWRILGMAAQLDPGEPPLFLNFEQPDELERRMRVAETPAEGAGGTADGAQTAPGTQNGDSSGVAGTNAPGGVRALPASQQQSAAQQPVRQAGRPAIRIRQ